MRAPSKVLLLLLLLAIPACGGQQRAPSGPLPDRTTVRVDNRKFLDVTVYVWNGGQRVRLGLVPGTSTRTFTIPSSLIFGTSTLRFQADPIGASETPVSHEIAVREGDEVGLVIQP
jgi:hypothetical protein